MPAHFVLKRFLDGFEEYGDLYEAIKSGRKTVEYRDATKHWKTRLLTPKAVELLDSDERGINLVFRYDLLKHDKAVFVVGYTKYPRLVADITKIVYDHEAEQLQTHIVNVKEKKREPKKMKMSDYYLDDEPIDYVEPRLCDTGCGHFDSLNQCCWIVPKLAGLFTNVSEGDICKYGFEEGSYD